MPTHSPPTAAPEDDDALLEAVRRGSMVAFSSLVRRYNRRLFRLARSIVGDDAEAEDVVQESYVRAYVHLSQFTSGCFSAWLCRIAVNEARGRFRTQRRRDELRGKHFPEDLAMANTISPEQRTVSHQLRAVLEQAIDDLPDGFRTVFVLRDLEQASTRETAKILDIEEATVKTRLHRARSLLRQALERRLQDEILDVFPFAGDRCDRIVATVLARIRTLTTLPH